MRYRTPHFKLTTFDIFLRVGLCPTRFSVAGELAASQASDRKRDSLIAWTRVHAITNFNMCAKSGISGDDQRPYLMTRGGTRYVRSPS